MALDLEDFGRPGGGRGRTEKRIAEEAARARGEGHAAGYAEGFAEAARKADDEMRAAVAALIESARDLELAREAARAEAIAAVGPVVEALARLAAPRAAEAGLAGEIAAAVRARLEAAPADRLTARVAPAQAEALAERLGAAVEIAPDPGLAAAEARLEWPGGGARFDPDACVEAACAAIARFFGETAAAAPAAEEFRDVG